MNSRLANSISIAGIIALGLYIAFMYAGLPDPIPTHWDAEGRANGYMTRTWGVVTLLIVPAFLFVVFKLIPAISPRGFRTDSFAGVVNIMMTVSVLFACVIGVVVIEVAAGAPFDISSFVLIAVGVLFAVLGSLLGKVRKNFFIGIRTPWTLASDEVWVKTHRVGSWCFVLAGIVMMVFGFVAPASTWFIWIVLVLALIPVVYSYVAYRRIEGFAPDPGE